MPKNSFFARRKKGDFGKVTKGAWILDGIGISGGKCGFGKKRVNHTIGYTFHLAGGRMEA
jgi:hypothetical protein